MSLLSGHCLRGSVAFEVAEPLGRAAYCHCTRCQRRTGNASSAGVRVAREIAAVRIGVLDPGHDVRPIAHVRTATAAAWEPIPDGGLPRLDGPP